MREGLGKIHKQIREGKKKSSVTKVTENKEGLTPPRGSN